MTNFAVVLRNYSIFAKLATDFSSCMESCNWSSGPGAELAYFLGESFADGELGLHVLRLATESKRKWVFTGLDTWTTHCPGVVACEMHDVLVEPDGGIKFGPTHHLKLLGEALKMYGVDGVNWIKEFVASPDASRHFWRHFVLDSAWWSVLTGYPGLIFPLLYRTIAISGELPMSTVTMIHIDLVTRSKEAVPLWKDVTDIAQLSSDPACDRKCYLEIATHYGFLALDALAKEDTDDLQVYVAFAQSNIHFSLLRTLSDCINLPNEELSLFLQLCGSLSFVFLSPKLELWRQVSFTAKSKKVTKSDLLRLLPSPTTTSTTSLALEQSQSEVQLPVLSPDLALRLYRLMDVAAKVLAWGRVRWFASHGTLLGAIRHRGIIPHDDDVDITVLEEDAGLLLSRDVQIAFHRNGYMLAYDTRVDSYVIYRCGETKTTTLFDPRRHHFDYSNPKINVFLMRRVTDFYEYTFGFDSFRFPATKLFFEEAEGFPTVPFGDSRVAVPARYEDYLTIMYGNDWKFVAHSMKYGLDKAEFTSRRLDRGGFGMALPTGPLPPVTFPPWEVRR